MLPPVSPSSAAAGSADPRASAASQDVHESPRQPERAAALSGLSPRPKSHDVGVMSETLEALFGTREQAQLSEAPRSVSAEGLRLEVLSSALPVLPLRLRPAMARRLGAEASELSSPVHEGRALRTLVDAALREAPGSLTEIVLNASGKIPVEDEAALLTAIVSSPHSLPSSPRPRNDLDTMKRLFEAIRRLPDSYQVDGLTQLRSNAALLETSSLLDAVNLRFDIDAALQTLPPRAPAAEGTAPRPGLPEIVESLFGGLEKHADSQPSGVAATVDQLTALWAALPVALELSDRNDRSKTLSKTLSERLLSWVLALDEPEHRFAALRQLVSRSADQPTFDDALAEQPSAKRGGLLDYVAYTRITDAMSALPSQYQSMLLQSMLPACIVACDASERPIMIDRILALLPGMDLDDRTAALMALVNCRPLEFVEEPNRRLVASTLRDAIFAQGAEQPSELLIGFATDVVPNLTQTLQHHFMNDIVRFVSALPPESRRAKASALLSSKAIPWYLDEKLASAARN